MPLDGEGRYYARLRTSHGELRVYGGETVDLKDYVDLLDDLPDNVILQGKGKTIIIERG